MHEKSKDEQLRRLNPFQVQWLMDFSLKAVFPSSPICFCIIFKGFEDLDQESVFALKFLDVSLHDLNFILKASNTTDSSELLTMKIKSEWYRNSRGQSFGILWLRSWGHMAGGGLQLVTHGAGLILSRMFFCLRPDFFLWKLFLGKHVYVVVVNVVTKLGFTVCTSELIFSRYKQNKNYKIVIFLFFSFLFL